MASWKNWLRHRPSALQTHAPPAEVEAVRGQLLALLDDCQGLESDRLRWRLQQAASAQDLWLLRGAAFQVVANQHCQAQAADRVNALIPDFRRVLPDRPMARV